MRLWHQELIPYLPKAQLLGQHRECCALRGLGWGRKHATVQYVFSHPLSVLEKYHRLVMEECIKRGIHIDEKWLLSAYRGKRCPAIYTGPEIPLTDHMIYPEHDAEYLRKCLNNLARKKVDMSDWERCQNTNKKK